MPLVQVETAAGRYDVRVEAGSLSRIGETTRAALGLRRLFVLADETVWGCLGERVARGLGACDWTLLAMKLGEPRKRLGTVEEICSAMHRAGADRRSVVVALGGGVAGDVGGFVAASYMRGIDVVQVPTTLLAQVDASVGGKTGVNLSTGKNLVGAFHQPRLVLIDPESLDTLPAREYRAGLQEVIKHGIIRSRPLFDFMQGRCDAVLNRELSALEYMIEASIRIKSAVVQADEHEGGLRRILNFGHTLGHALEAETNYDLLLHGEAVAYGMVAAARLSELRGRLEPADRERIERVVLAYASFPDLRSLDPLRIAARIVGDKKAVGGKARFVLADGIGSVSEELAPPCEQVIEAARYAIRTCSARGTATV